jgi:hypothetical protein
MKEIIIALTGALSTAVGGVLAAWLLARVQSGRLTRTLDQATKVLEFVERYSAVYNGLEKISEGVRPEVEKLLHDTAQAIKEDYAAERASLPEFERSTSSVRAALLLYIPNRTATWVPFLLFHTMVLFMLYVCIVRLVQARWEILDTAVLIVAGIIAALARLAVSTISKRA